MSRPGKSVRQSMAWLHTWSGLVVGWVLFAIFVTGTASYYRAEISHWMRPELSEPTADPATAATRAAAYLKRQMPDALAWSVKLPTTEHPSTEVYWWNHPGRTVSPRAARSRHRRGISGARHPGRRFPLPLPFRAEPAADLGTLDRRTCAMILLISLITGIITHRRIFADFFTFRRDKSAQRGWLDAHNVVGVLALPFHLMIVYTGLIELGPMLMPWGVKVAYQHDIRAYYAESGIMRRRASPRASPAA